VLSPDQEIKALAAMKVSHKKRPMAVVDPFEPKRQANRILVRTSVELAVKKGGAEASGGCGLGVSVGSGRRIVVEAGFDAASLQRLVQVLERM
jgi:hypothetical protein